MYLNDSDIRIPLQPNAVVQITPEKRFIIDKYIASGGFSLMYLAHQEGSGRYVALKELYPRQAPDALIQRLDSGKILIWNPFSDLMGPNDAALMEEFTKYFHRESLLTQRAGAVYAGDGGPERQNNLDVLQVEGPMTDIHGNMYLAVDTYQGESLRDFLERGFVRDKSGKVISNQFLSEIIPILAETAIRLSALHDSEDMYHLDLSPDNIYLAFAAGKTRRQPYIIDYGSAYDRTNPQESLEHRYTCNLHSAPEILALAEAPDPTGFYHIDESSDTYSLASILFYAATGLIFTPEMRMFSTGWKEQLISAYSSGLQKEQTDSFCAKLIAFFEKGLSSTQEDRYGSAKALLDALRELEEEYRKYGNLLPMLSKDELMSYLVLEKHPLYNYRSENGEIHVLCLGCGTFVKRMILSLISCGQFVNSPLHIHVVSDGAQEDFRKAMLHSAPALREFSDLCGEPERKYVSFHYTQVENVLAEDTCRQILDTHSDAHYLLISLGRNRLNTQAAELYARGLAEKNCGRRTILNYYCAEDAASGTAPTICVSGLPQWLEVDAFGDDLMSYTTAQRDLGMRTIRLAHMYNKLGDPKISLAETASQIAGDAYGQKSSCASALHLKYKLADLGIDPDGPREQTIEAYLAALQGEVYGKLLENEHNRWLMYMVAEGYQMPTVEQMRCYGFETVGTKFNAAWKSKDLLLHHCMVPCGDGGITLTNADWDTYTTEEAIAASSFDGLDKISLLVHLLAKEKCDEILQSGMLDQLFKQMGDRLDSTIRKTRDAQDDAVPQALEQLKGKLEQTRETIRSATWCLQYSGDGGMLKTLQQGFEAVGINIAGEIRMLEEKLSVFREYAAFKDYKVPDEAIVRNLLWLLYADERIRLIKLGGKTIAGNIAAPLVMDPEDLVYFGLEQQPDWISFLRQHGYRGQITFLPCAHKTVDCVFRALQELAQQPGGRIVIDLTEADEVAVIAAYKLCDARSDVSLIRTDADGIIENIHNFPTAPIFVFNTKISADDVYELHGAKRVSQEYSYMEQLYDDVDALWDIYQDFREDWVDITALFAHNRANQSELFVNGIRITPNEVWETTTANIGKDHWNALNLTAVFEQMESCGIIRSLSLKEFATGRLKVTFQYPQSAANGYLGTNLGRFLKDTVPRAFAPFHCEITGNSTAGYCLNVRSGYTVNLRSDELTYSDHRLKPFDRKRRMDYDKTFPALRRLEQAGIISDLHTSITPDAKIKVNISFVYSTLAAKECLKTAGNILELKIWYEAKRARFFDSIQTNYFFTWKGSAGITNELDVILTRGLTSLIISAKTAKFNKEHLYEISTLTNRFSLNSKAVIIYSSTEAIENGHKTTNLAPVKNRAREMGIYLIDLNELEGSLSDKLIRIATGQDLP